MRKRWLTTLNNEQGFVLGTSLMMLMLLTLVGAAATTSTNTEIQIAGNEKVYYQTFYVAESGWQRGLQMIDNKASPPARLNPDETDGNEDNVKNYGNDDEINDDFPEGVRDGDLGENTIPYWYRVVYENDTKVAGGSKNYRDFFYSSNSVAGNEKTRQEIETVETKIFKVAYKLK